MPAGSPGKARKGKDAGNKQEKNKQPKKRDTLEQEFRRTVAEKMAEGIRKMVKQEEQATQVIQREKAKLELETAAEKKARKKRRREERLAAKRAAEGKTSTLPALRSGTPKAEQPNRIFFKPDPKIKHTSKFGSRAQTSIATLTEQIHVTEFSQYLFGFFTGKKKKRLISTLSSQLHDPRISNKKRRQVAAMMIQRAVQNIILDPIRRERAARVIQKNFNIYKEYLMRQKWMIMIKLEKKSRAEAERRAHESRIKRDRHKAMVAAEEKKRMERQAMRAGAWNPQEMKNRQKGWSKREEAILVALNYAHGLPSDEDSWELYCEEFPKRKKIDVVKMVNKMKVTGAIHDLELFDELDPEELQRIVQI